MTFTEPLAQAKSSGVLPAPSRAFTSYGMGNEASRTVRIRSGLFSRAASCSRLSA